MAGAALTTPLKIIRVDEVIGTFPIKSAEVVNEGDLVGLDSNFQVVVATQAAGANIHALGFAFFDDEHGPFTPRTGVAGLTVKTGIARRGKIGGLTSTLLGASVAAGRVFLGPAPAAGVSNYSQTLGVANTVLPQYVGFTTSATEMEVDVCPSILQGQTAGTSDANLN